MKITAPREIHIRNVPIEDDEIIVLFDITSFL